MNLSKKIKQEVFFAFIHSRLVNIAGDENTDTPALTKESTNIVESYGKTIENYVSSVCTLADVNNKISSNGSYFIAKMYEDNYKKLLKLFDNKLTVGEEIIPSLIGVGMILSYMEFSKTNIDLDMNKISNIFLEYESSIPENKHLVIKMMKASAYITETYWNHKDVAFGKNKRKKVLRTRGAA